MGVQGKAAEERHAHLLAHLGRAPCCWLRCVAMQLLASCNKLLLLLPKLLLPKQAVVKQVVVAVGSARCCCRSKLVLPKLYSRVPVLRFGFRVYGLRSRVWGLRSRV